MILKLSAWSQFLVFFSQFTHSNQKISPSPRSGFPCIVSLQSSHSWQRLTLSLYISKESNCGICLCCKFFLQKDHCLSFLITFHTRYICTTGYCQKAAWLISALGSGHIFACQIFMAYLKPTDDEDSTMQCEGYIFRMCVERNEYRRLFISDRAVELWILKTWQQRPIYALLQKRSVRPKSYSDQP